MIFFYQLRITPAEKHQALLDDLQIRDFSDMRKDWTWHIDKASQYKNLWYHTVEKVGESSTSL